jgi:hypothetical protein
MPETPPCSSTTEAPAHRTAANAIRGRGLRRKPIPHVNMSDSTACLMQAQRRAYVQLCGLCCCFTNRHAS